MKILQENNALNVYQYVSLQAKSPQQVYKTTFPSSQQLNLYTLVYLSYTSASDDISTLYSLKRDKSCTKSDINKKAVYKTEISSVLYTTIYFSLSKYPVINSAHGYCIINSP